MSALLGARVLAGALVRAGVLRAVVSPGSRSTPLILALEELRQAGRVALDVVLDERAAAFFALGAARATGAPSLLVCTSGSAPAHWLPALVEASQAGLPLIALSADRPPELADCAASQTVAQVGMFGAFVRASWDLAVPEAAPGALAGLARRAGQAVALALGPDPGPVHLDARFRKPLEGGDDSLVSADSIVAAAPRVEPARAVASPAALRLVLARLSEAVRPVVVAGPARGSEHRWVLGLAAALGAPILAEPTSGLSAFAHPDQVVPHLDTVTRAGTLRAFEPDLVLEVGLPPVSSAYAELAATWGPRRVVLAGSPALSDPTNLASSIVLGAAAEQLALGLAARPPLEREHPLLRAGLAASAAASACLARAPLSDAAAVAATAGALEESCDLLIGNSLVVRELDAFVGPLRARVLHQRGAAGIDGLVAGAAGGAAASGRPTACLLGDLAFAHDASSLALAARARTPLVLVVIDNGGGRIFDRLPVHEALGREAFERLFLTPAAVDHEALARAYGVGFVETRDPAALAQAVRAALARPTATVVVARTTPSPEAWAAVAAETRRALPQPERNT